MVSENAEVPQSKAVCTDANGRKRNVGLGDGETIFELVANTEKCACK